MRFFLIAILVYSLFAADIKPKQSIKLDSTALDMVFRKKLYVSSEKGDIYEVVASRAKKLYSLPYITTPIGVKRAQKALTLDVTDDAKMLAVGAEDGYLYLLKSGSLQKSGYRSDSVIKKVILLNNGQVLLGLVSSQIILFDIQKNRLVYSVQIGSSPLSDMALSADRKTIAMAGEAGTVYLINSMSGKVKAAYKNTNLDNIYKIDYQNKMILTAGQDRKSTLINESGVVKVRFEGEFLIYAAALSPSAGRAAVAINEQSDIAIFDVLSKSRMATARGHQATLNRMVFLNENELVSCADENKILIWGIK